MPLAGIILLQSRGDNRYVRRDGEGIFKEAEDVGSFDRSR